MHNTEHRTEHNTQRRGLLLSGLGAGDFYAVSYAWAAEASIDKRVRILRNLGRE